MTNPYAHTFSIPHEFEYSIRDYVRSQIVRLNVATGGESYYNNIRGEASKEKFEWHVSAGSTHDDIVSVKMEVLEKAVDAVITMYNAKQGGKLSLLPLPITFA
jgi:hypothetical protein